MRYEEGSFKTFQLENKQFRKIVLNVCQAFLSFKTENVEIYEAPTMHISVTFNGRKNVFFRTLSENILFIVYKMVEVN